MTIGDFGRRVEIYLTTKCEFECVLKMGYLYASKPLGCKFLYYVKLLSGNVYSDTCLLGNANGNLERSRALKKSIKHKWTFGISVNVKCSSCSVRMIALYLINKSSY